MTRKDISRVVSEQLGLTQRQTSQIIRTLFDAIVNTLAQNGRAELRNFGVFEVKWRKSRKGRNPRTGKKVMVPEKCTVTFRPGQAVAERVRVESRTAATDGKSHREAPVQPRP